MSTVFINYRTGDEGFAAVHLDDRLCERFGAENVFRDSRSIPAGTEFARRLWGELAGCSLLIVVIGAHWDTVRLRRPGDYVRREIAYALENGIGVMPVLVGAISMPKDEELPDDIRRLRDWQYKRIDVRSSESDVNEIVDAVAQSLGEKGRRSRDSGSRSAGKTAPDVRFRDLHGDLVMGDKTGGDTVMGDKVMGDKVMGDKIVWRG